MTIFGQQTKKGGSSGGGGGEAVDYLDPVLTITNTPPVTPADGARYLVGTAPTGTFVTHANNVAQWDEGGSAYVYTIPVLGDYVFVNDTLLTYRFNGTAWAVQPGAAILQNGNSFGAGGAMIGTNDNAPVNFKTNGVVRGVFTAAGKFLVGSVSSVYASSKMEVIGRLAVSDLIASMSAAGVVYGFVSGSAGAYDIAANNDVNLSISTSGTGYIKVLTGGSERVRVLADGSVGIGLAGATAKLHVLGAGSTSSTMNFLFQRANTVPLLAGRDDGSLSIGVSPDADFKLMLKNYEGKLVSFTCRSSTDQADFTVFNNAHASVKNSLAVGYYSTAPSNATLYVKGIDDLSSSYNFRLVNNSETTLLSVKNNGVTTIFSGGYAAITCDAGSNLTSHNYTYLFNGIAFGSGTAVYDNTINMPSTWTAGFGGVNSGATVNIVAGAHINALTINGHVNILGLPTSSAGLVTGDIWLNSNVLTAIP